MKKTILIFALAFMLPLASAHMAQVATPGDSQTVWEEMEESHREMHRSYGDKFYCNSQGCYGTGIGNMPYNMYAGMYGENLGSVTQLLVAVAALLAIVFFALKISKELRG